MVKPIEYRQGARRKFRTIAFRKRIQISVYNQNIISNFALLESIKVI
jgi:hypothetical protein